MEDHVNRPGVIVSAMSACAQTAGPDRPVLSLWTCVSPTHVSMEASVLLLQAPVALKMLHVNVNRAILGIDAKHW